MRWKTILALAAAICATGTAAAAPCGDWELVPTPNVGNSVTRLTAVAALSADDAWSVGYWRNEPAGRGPLAIRWDGHAWAQVDLPETGHLGTFPETAGVADADNGDLWVVGNVTTSYPTNNLPLVLRWRGDDWDHVDTVVLRPQTVYPFADRGGFAYAVDALAADDAWAVGIAAGFGDGAATSVPMALHWDGSSWTDVEVPRVANRHHELSAVVMISPDDVWAVGDYRNVGGAFRGVTYHWDGLSWSHVYSPIEGVLQSGLEDVVATGPDDVWAIGGGDTGVILMHWDGTQWSLAVPPPDSGGSLAAVAPGDLWASGWNGFWRWNGASWTDVPAEVPGAAYVIRSGGMEIVGGCDIWCAGFWTLADGITSYTLAERLEPPTAAIAAGTDEIRSLTIRNPYTPGYPIRIPSPAGSAGIARVHDLSGRIVRTLAPAGGDPHGAVVQWDGRADGGRPAPAGIYFLHYESPHEVARARLVLLQTAR